MGLFNDSYSPVVGPDGDAPINANDIYGKLLFHPRSDIAPANQTFEGLNGGIDYRHFSPFEKITNGLDAGCFRTGTFARGYNYGFNFPDRYHASMYTASTAQQLGGAASQRLYHVHQSFAVRFFCPWKASCFITWQGWFKAELSKFSGKQFGERWDLKLRINGHVHAGSYAKVPSMKHSTSSSSGSKTTKSSKEDRFRWLQRSLQFEAKRGFNTIEVMNWPSIIKEYADNDDRQTPKMVTMCGGISVLAVRLNHEGEGYQENNETGHKTQLPYNGGEGTNSPFSVSENHPDFNTKDVEQLQSINDIDFDDDSFNINTLTEDGQDIVSGPRIREPRLESGDPPTSN
tara:strand:- start:2255 stop:3289 length:1035 start_codon:yes stop_codon:yes gene_type:complete